MRSDFDFLEYDPEFDMGENMFKDISLSRDLVDAYKQYKSKSNMWGRSKSREQMDVDGEEEDGPKFTMMVLQQSVWPFSARKQNVDLPVQVIMSHLSYVLTTSNSSPHDFRCWIRSLRSRNSINKRIKATF